MNRLDLLFSEVRNLSTDEKRRLKILLFIMPLFFSILLLVVRILAYPIYEVIGKEDSIIEYSQSLILLFSSALSFLLFIRLKNHHPKLLRYTFLVGTVFLFFVAMEEISWGQRILGFKPPENIDIKNVQNEFNIHNFDPIHYRIWKLNLLILVYSFFGWLFEKIVNWVNNQNLMFLKLFFVSFYLFPYFFWLIINLYYPIAAPQDFEMSELFMYTGIMLLLLRNLYWVSIRNKGL